MKQKMESILKDLQKHFRGEWLASMQTLTWVRIRAWGVLGRRQKGAPRRGHSHPHREGSFWKSQTHFTVALQLTEAGLLDCWSVLEEESICL